MGKITWLHVSDYHTGERDESTNREWTKDRMLEDVAGLLDVCGSPDAIFFSGDLTWSGQENQFIEAQEFLDELRHTAGDLPTERLFIVPGNHDIDRHASGTEIERYCVGLVARNLSDEENVRKTLGNFLGPNSTFRRLVFGKFDNYFRFVNRYLGWSLDAEGYLAVRSFNIDDKKVAVLALNSAWMSPVAVGSWVKERDQGYLLLGQRQLSDALSHTEVADAEFSIALMHHPLSWLQTWDEAIAKSMLYKQCKFILHGHLHMPEIFSVATPDGQTMVIPGGACYSRMHHTNSYNLVQLDLADNEGVIYFRRYDPRVAGRWFADTSLYEGAPRGEYRFNLDLAKGSSSMRVAQSPHTQTAPSSSQMEPLTRSVEQAYFRYLVRECVKVPISPIDPNFASRTGIGSIPLTEVYIPLTASKSAMDLRGGSGPGAAIPIPQALMGERGRAFVLLGEPGSGKSTLVNYLTYCFAQSHLDTVDELERQEQSRVAEDLAAVGWRYPNWRPLRIVLRETIACETFTAEGEGKASQIWESLFRDIAEHVPGGVLAEAGHKYQTALFSTLHNEGGLIMFDGLDEVPPALISQVKGAIEDFAQTMPKTRIIVTCRSYAYQNPAYQLENGFRVLDLCRFDRKQIEAFVERWYAWVASVRDRDLTWRQEQTGSLIEATLPTSLTELAARPLLLTLMATLHTEWGRLPEDRSQLYEQCVELLLTRWEQAKWPLLSDDPSDAMAMAFREQKFRQKVSSAISEVAYRLFKRQEKAAQAGEPVPDQVDSGLLLEALARRVDEPRRVLDYIQNRAGLLLPAGRDTYVFPHRSFQEYLVVCHLFNNRRSPRQLASLVRDNPSWWREPFLLAVGKAASNGVDYAVHFVNALSGKEYSWAPPPSRADWWAAGVAGEALVEIKNRKRWELDDSYSDDVERIQKWLIAWAEEGALSPTERAFGGDVMAHLGDPRPGVGVVQEAPDICWCEVPAGQFIMGSGTEGREERPGRSSCTGRYFISRYAVTNAQFEAFANADDGYRHEANWTETGLEFRGNRAGPDRCGGAYDLPNHPVVSVSWYEATAFCEWLTRRMRKGEWPIVDGEFAMRVWRGDRAEQHAVPEGWVVRLPTEAEYEKAARGTSGQTYPWGEEIDADCANFEETGIRTTCAVGLFPKGASPYGVLDISGNAWSWCHNKWNEQDPRRKYAFRVVRGGGFTSLRDWLRCSYRRRHSPEIYHCDDGFRIVLVEADE